MVDENWKLVILFNLCISRIKEMMTSFGCKRNPKNQGILDSWISQKDIHTVSKHQFSGIVSLIILGMPIIATLFPQVNVKCHTMIFEFQTCPHLCWSYRDSKNFVNYADAFFSETQALVDIHGTVLCKEKCDPSISISLLTLVGRSRKERSTFTLTHESSDFRFPKVSPGKYWLEVSCYICYSPAFHSAFCLDNHLYMGIVNHATHHSTF